MKVPNTISDAAYKKLQTRAHKANPDTFSDKAIKQRKWFEGQRLNADKS